MDQFSPQPANSCPLTPLTYLERASLVYGECTSIVYNSTTYTWSDTYNRCLRLASSISSLGIQRGHVVSAVASNIPAMYELQFAVPMAGAVLNNINTRLDARTISVILQHGESKLVFVDYYLRSLVLEALRLFPSNLQTPMLILILDEGETEFESSPSPSSIHGFHATYEGLVRKGNGQDLQWVRPKSEWDPMTLNYTSGTTSSPKGVVHSHRALFLATFNSLVDWPLPKQPVYLWTLPMFHSNGWSYTWSMAAVGGTNICLRKFDAGVIYAAINRHNVTHMCGAPVVLNMIANSSQAKPLKNPVHFFTGGAPPPAAVVLRAESLGFVVSHGYGLTEVGCVVVSCAWKPKWNLLPATERARLKARQGVRVLGLTEVDVVDPVTGVSVKRDGSTMGEIVLRGGNLMRGYLKDPEGTSKCMRENGWLYTGDVGVMHPDGYLEIKDRSKDIIISGGELRLPLPNSFLSLTNFTFLHLRTTRVWTCVNVLFLNPCPTFSKFSSPLKSEEAMAADEDVNPSSLVSQLSQTHIEWKQEMDRNQALVDALQAKILEVKACVQGTEEHSKELDILWQRVKTAATALSYLKSKARVMAVPHLAHTSCGIKQLDGVGLVDKNGVPLSGWSRNVDLSSFDDLDEGTWTNLTSQNGSVDEQHGVYSSQLLKSVEVITDVMEGLVKRAIMAESETAIEKEKVTIGLDEIKRKGIQIENMSLKLDEMERFAFGTNCILNEMRQRVEDLVEETSRQRQRAVENEQELHRVKRDFDSLKAYVSGLISVRETLLSSEKQFQTIERLFERLVTKTTQLENEKMQKETEVQKLMEENVRLSALLDKKEAQLLAMNEQCKVMALSGGR